MNGPSSWIHTAYAQRVHFGAGALNRVTQILRETASRSWMLVTTEGRLASDDGRRLERLLGRSLTSTFAGAAPHVPADVVQRAVQQARRDGVDGIVSFGGGSCADLGKAVCFFLEQESGAPGASYIDRPSLAHVTVPTTYSGAELTPFFGMTDPGTRQKRGAGGPTIAPLAAVYDPEVTLGLPGRQSAETGMNALAHGIEAAYSPVRSPEAEALALTCIMKVAVALPQVVDDPTDLTARTEMLAAAVLGGRCLHNAGMGVHHGLAQLVGGRTGMAHGLANAVILPHAMRFNQEAVPGELRRIGGALGDPDDPPGAVARLLERLGLPAGLNECGLTLDDIDAVARLAPSNTSVQANPRPVSEDDVREILAAAF